MSIDAALERYFDAWNSHEPERVAAALTDGGTYEDPTTGGPLSGDALTASVAGVLAGFPDVHFEVDSVATNGDTASAQWRMLGTNTGPLLTPAGSVPPTGRPVIFTELRIDRFEQGRIVESWFLPDRLTLWQQLGLVPTPGAKD